MIDGQTQGDREALIVTKKCDQALYGQAKPDATLEHRFMAGQIESKEAVEVLTHRPQLAEKSYASH